MKIKYILMFFITNERTFFKFKFWPHLSRRHAILSFAALHCAFIDTSHSSAQEKSQQETTTTAEKKMSARHEKASALGLETKIDFIRPKSGLKFAISVRKRRLSTQDASWAWKDPSGHRKWGHFVTFKVGPKLFRFEQKLVEKCYPSLPTFLRPIWDFFVT